MSEAQAADGLCQKENLAVLLHIRQHMNLKTLVLPIVALAMTAAHANDFNVVSKRQLSGHFPSAQFANAMGCTGKNLSPHLAWQGAPQGSNSSSNPGQFTWRNLRSSYAALRPKHVVRPLC